MYVHHTAVQRYFECRPHRERTVYLHSVVYLWSHFCVGSSLQAEFCCSVGKQGTRECHLEQQPHTPENQSVNQSEYEPAVYLVIWRVIWRVMHLLSQQSI